MLISCHKLGVSFHRVPLFQDISLELDANQSVWLQGANGAGKTTLLKLVAKLTRADSGKVTYHNGAERRGAVIYLHQQPYLFAGSVRKNLEFGLKSNRVGRPQRTEAVNQVLKMARLDHLAERSAQVLSGGERQRLALARAWVLQPKVMLLDEPTANLDPESVQLIASMVQQLQQQGCTIVITSHQQTPLTDLCQQQWKLAEGKLSISQLQERCA